MNTHEERNVNGEASNTFDAENNEMRQEKAPESTADPKPRKPRRKKPEIEAEYQTFKEYYDIGYHFLEISSMMKISNAQCSKYLSKISLAANLHQQKDGVCKGFNIPEPIYNYLKGGKEDLYKYVFDQDKVFITIIKH